MKVFWLPVLIITLVRVHAEEMDYTQLCRLFPASTRLRMPGSCEKYIECDGTKGEVFSCMAPEMFDPQKKSCIETSDSTSLCRNRCGSMSGKWVADPTNCHGYLYCQNGEELQGYCKGDLHFNEKLQMCVHSDTSICVDVSSICEVSPDKMKFRDETDCSYYYECTKGVQSRKSCSGKYFNVEKQSCVDKTTMDCKAHPIPKNICIVSKKPYTGLRSDQATCRGFFNCANLGIVEDKEPTWNQCPVGKFFSQAKQTCVNPIDAKCPYNRCEGRGNNLVVSGSNNCHNYLICEDGFVKAEKTCSKDYFFNEDAQACVPYIIDYECCDIKNLKKK